MNEIEEIKKMVREKYTEIATQDKDTNASSCCGSTCCSDEVYHLMADDYSKMEGYQAGSDLGLGCGLPTEFAKIKKGDVVIDLGSGAGNDCFIARAETGETGKVIGVDMTEAMIALARMNAEKLNFNNVEFRLGDIEKMPVTSAIADVVVSNCVLNLVPEKQKAISEIYRVLKPGGHFSISDIVLKGTLPPSLLRTAELYAGCISGAIQKEDYLGMIKNAGFENIIIQKEKPIHVPDDILKEYLNEAELTEYKNAGVGIFSVTVYAEKKKEPCCDPAEKCC